MQNYIMRRLMFTIPTLLGLSIVIFIMLRVMPGDLVDVYVAVAQIGRITPEERRAIEVRLGTDRPLVVQYGVWLKGVFTGDMGPSFKYRRPAWEIIRARLPVSIQLGLMGTTIAVLIGIPLGVVCAIGQDKWSDQLLRFFSLLGISVPAFWLGMLVIIVLVSSFRWLPPLTYVSPFEDLTANLSQFIFPALVVGVNQWAIILRMTRSSMLEVLREDYVRTARAKGLAEIIVMYRHALRNALIPIVTIVALQIPLMIGSMVVVETVFNLPGASRFISDAIRDRDYPMVQGLVMLTGVFVVFSNLTADLLYGWLNPRVRYE